MFEGNHCPRPKGLMYEKKRTKKMAKIYTDLEFGDPAWVIRKVHIDNQFLDDTGRWVTITEDGETIMEDETDLVAIVPALDE